MPATASNRLHVDSARLWDSLMRMAEIGALPGGGNRRLGLTPEDSAGRKLLVGWAEAQGYGIGRDQVGNLFIRRPGTRPDLPVVMMGSHLDTVFTGGRFDGVLGVLGGFEVLRALDDANIATERTLELVAWTNEEGARFAPGNTGAFAFVGRYTLEQALAHADIDGSVVGQALEALGEIGEEPVGGRPVAAYFELHIEQGPYLERAGNQIGIVTGTYTVRYFNLTIMGDAAHIAQPLPDRRDALIGAAEVILATRRVGLAHGEEGRGNLAWMKLFPNVRGTVATTVEMSFDVRHADPRVTEAMAAELHQDIAAIGQRTGLEMRLVPFHQVGPVSFDPALVSLLRETAKTRGYRTQDILTVAGHDAIALAPKIPSAMIFVPCAGGLSHNEREYAEPSDCAAGTDVLMHAVLAKAGRG